MTVRDFTEMTIGTQIVQIEEMNKIKFEYYGNVEKLRQKNEILEREIEFFTSFDYPNRIIIRLK